MGDNAANPGHPRQAGVSSFERRMRRAHTVMAVALLVWFVLFVAGIVVYHALGKPAGMDDVFATVFASIFVVLWVGAQAVLFVTNFFVRRMHIGAFVCLVFPGVLLAVPLVNAGMMVAMAPEVPKPEGEGSGAA
ncbi:MAG: hypothetical protein R3B49_00260 [Phycisphaerales bacterium]